MKLRDLSGNIPKILIGLSAIALASCGSEEPAENEALDSSYDTANTHAGAMAEPTESPEDLKDDEYVAYMTMGCSAIDVPQLKQSCLGDARHNIDSCSETNARYTDEDMRACMDQYLDGYTPDRF